MSSLAVDAADFLAGSIRLLCGVRRLPAACLPAAPGIFFANHSSHLDFAVLWAALPSDERRRTHPVAGRDYWEATALRRWIARRVFHAVLIERQKVTAASNPLVLLMPVVLFTRMALNAIDGMLAREHNMKSPLGGILNELGDVVSDTALYLPFALVPGLSSALVIAVVLLAVVSEMTGVVAVQIGASRRYDGPLGKSDRAFLFGLLGLVGGLGVPFGCWADLVLAMAVLLLVLTILNRSRKALAEIATAS